MTEKSSSTSFQVLQAGWNTQHLFCFLRLVTGFGGVQGTFSFLSIIAPILNSLIQPTFLVIFLNLLEKTKNLNLKQVVNLSCYSRYLGSEVTEWRTTRPFWQQLKQRAFWSFLTQLQKENHSKQRNSGYPEVSSILGNGRHPNLTPFPLCYKQVLVKLMV